MGAGAHFVRKALEIGEGYKSATPDK